MKKGGRYSPALFAISRQVLLRTHPQHVIDRTADTNADGKLDALEFQKHNDAAKPNAKPASKRSS